MYYTLDMSQEKCYMFQHLGQRTTQQMRRIEITPPCWQLANNIDLLTIASALIYYSI